MFDSFPKDCKYVGFSATPIRFLDGKRNMAEELFDGCIANEIGLADAILNSILPLPRYIAGLYTYDNEVNAITRRIQNSRNTDEEKEKLLEEVAIMKKNLDKSKGISSIFKKYINQDKGKYIAFCRNITHLRQMKPCLVEWFSEAGISVNLYEVHCKSPKNDKQFKEFMNDDKLAVCLSVAMLAEGVHGIDGVILLRDTISPNLYYQQIGRAFSVDMRSVPIIFDLVANCESIMDCSLKNDLLDVIDRKHGGNKNGNSGINGDKNTDGKEITKEDIEKFFVYDQVLDAVNAFKEIEGKLYVSWNQMYQEYCKFYEENGHGDVPSSNEYEKLYNWCYQQRKDLNNKVLKTVRKELLDRKGFIWSIHKYRFLCAMKDVKCFLKEKGEYPKRRDIFNGKRLGIFVDSERKYKKDLEYKSEIYPQWKSEIIKNLGLYDFFCEERQISDLVINKSFSFVTGIEEKEKRIS